MAAFPSGPGIRVDGWAEPGLTVSPYYDSLLAKVIAWGQDRDEARTRLELALRETHIHPVLNTAHFLAGVVAGAPFASGVYDTSLLADSPPAAARADDARLLALAASELIESRERAQSTEYVSRPLAAWQRPD